MTTSMETDQHMQTLRAQALEAMKKKEEEARKARDRDHWCRILRNLPAKEKIEAIVAALKQGWYDGVNAATAPVRKCSSLNEVLNYAKAEEAEGVVADYVTAIEGLQFLTTSDRIGKSTCMAVLAKLAQEGHLGAWGLLQKKEPDAAGPSQGRSDPNPAGGVQGEGLDWNKVKEAASRRLQEKGFPPETITELLETPGHRPSLYWKRDDEAVLLYLAMLAVGLIGVTCRPCLDSLPCLIFYPQLIPLAEKHRVLPELLRLESPEGLTSHCCEEEALAKVLELARGGGIRAEQVLADALAFELARFGTNKEQVILPFVLKTFNSQFAPIPASAFLVSTLHSPREERCSSQKQQTAWEGIGAQTPKRIAVDIQLLTSSLALGGVLYGMWLRAHHLDGPYRRPPAWATEAQLQLGLEAESLDVERAAVALINDHEAERSVVELPLLVWLLKSVVGEQTKVLQTALANKYAVGANPVTEELLEVVRGSRQGQ